MEPSIENSESGQTDLVASPPDFGQLLRSRRELAGLSVADLARKAGLARATIHNIEEGLTTPSPQTLKLLAGIKALRLTELSSSSDTPIDAWCTAQYNPMEMTRTMVAKLNGPGGQVEQTYWYLDPQSASDFHALCNSEQYITAFRSKLPLDKVAERIVKLSKGVGIDVDGLGCGDGKTETSLMQRLADSMPPPPDLQLYLLDISHVLLAEAYRDALDSLAPRRIPVFAIHGSFYDIAKNPPLYMHPTSIRRMRVFLMMGMTIGNIENEPRFFRDLAECAQPGDLVVLDCEIARAPADQPERIRQMEPTLKAKRAPEAHTSFLSGPLKRHCSGLRSVRLRAELSTLCPVPGSYTLQNWADVEKDDEPERHFLVLQTKRYDLSKLSDCLLSLGWTTIQTWKYGPENQAAVLLLQKQ